MSNKHFITAVGYLKAFNYVIMVTQFKLFNVLIWKQMRYLFLCRFQKRLW